MAGVNLDNKNIKLPYLTLIFIVASVATLAFYMFFSIIPGYRSINKIRQDIIAINADLRMSEKVIPVYAKAKKIDEIQFNPSFSFPKRAKLDREKLPELLNKFKLLALQNSLFLIDNKLDTNFLNREPSSVSILFKSQGELKDFRSFLIEVISFPFFETIENITITPGKKELNNFTVNLKINIEAKNE